MPPRPPTSGAAVVGRVFGIVGICAALIAGTIWIVVGILALAAAPLCTECMQSWLPPVALGSLGPLVLWSITLIVRALEWFATLFNT